MLSRKHILVLLWLLAAATAWGQVGGIANVANLRGGLGAVSQSPTRTLPDSTATADTTTDDGMPKGIEYHEDIPDSVLQASIFFSSWHGVLTRVVRVSVAGRVAMYASMPYGLSRVQWPLH